MVADRVLEFITFAVEIYIYIRFALPQYDVFNNFFPDVIVDG